jgi:hypothetical protein
MRATHILALLALVSASEYTYRSQPLLNALYNEVKSTYASLPADAGAASTLPTTLIKNGTVISSWTNQSGSCSTDINATNSSCTHLVDSWDIPAELMADAIAKVKVLLFSGAPDFEYKSFSTNFTTAATNGDGEVHQVIIAGRTISSSSIKRARQLKGLYDDDDINADDDDINADDDSTTDKKTMTNQLAYMYVKTSATLIVQTEGYEYQCCHHCAIDWGQCCNTCNGNRNRGFTPDEILKIASALEGHTHHKFNDALASEAVLQAYPQIYNKVVSEKSTSKSSWFAAEIYHRISAIVTPQEAEQEGEAVVNNSHSLAASSPISTIAGAAIGCVVVAMGFVSLRARKTHADRKPVSAGGFDYNIL